MWNGEAPAWAWPCGGGAPSPPHIIKARRARCAGVDGETSVNFSEGEKERKEDKAFMTGAEWT